MTVRKRRCGLSILTIQNMMVLTLQTQPPKYGLKTMEQRLKLILRLKEKTFQTQRLYVLLQKDLHSTNMLCFSSKLKTETAYRRIPMPFLPQEKFSKRR